MQHLSSMLGLLSIGTVILMAGVLLLRDHGQSLQNAFTESLILGIGFFLAFSAEILLISHL